jgi:hypothetical protein
MILCLHTNFDIYLLVFMKRMLEIGVCNVDCWVGFVTRMTTAQRCELADADLECLLHMKCISPRRSILTQMIKAFDAESGKFNLQEDQPAITIKGVATWRKFLV